MFDIIAVTLEGVGYAMFNMTFIFGVWLVYSINKKLNILDNYRTVSRKPIIFLLSDVILQGVVVGAVTSLTLVIIGIPLYYNELLLMIIPISLALSIYRIRFLCITYSATVLAVISLVFSGQNIFGFQMYTVELHIPSLIILVGLLHLIEGVLVYTSGHIRAVPVLSKKDDKVVMGHILHKNWVIPLGLLVLQIGIMTAGGVEMPDWWPVIKYSGHGEDIIYQLLPVIGMLSYSSIVYNETPKERSRFSGINLIGFGALTVFVGTIAVNSIFLQVIGIATMVLIHEGLYYLEDKRERSKSPIYIVPEQGVRIMQITEGGFAQKVGMRQGDVIERINDVVINDIQHFVELIKARKEAVFIETKSLAGIEKRYIVEDSEDLEHMGIRIIPEKPLIVYPFYQFANQGIFEFLKRD